MSEWWKYAIIIGASIIAGGISGRYFAGRYVKAAFARHRISFVTKAWFREMLEKATK